MLHFLVFFWVGVDYLWYCPITTVLITAENQPIIEEIDSINSPVYFYIHTTISHKYKLSECVHSLSIATVYSFRAVRAVRVHNTSSSTLPLTWTEVHQFSKSTKGRYSKHCMYCVAKIRASSRCASYMYSYITAKTRLVQTTLEYATSANGYWLCIVL